MVPTETNKYYRKSTTANGTRVVTEQVENVRSVAVGFWVESGSRDESAEAGGISHFLEHMMFKGTEKRSALKIAREIEQVGGYLNAFTSKELTVYYAHLLDQHLPLAVDVLSDIVCHSKFAEKEVERERGVILEEISNSLDTPEEVIHENYVQNIFPDHSLGVPVLGNKDTVGSFKNSDIREYWSRNYTSGRLVVTAVGKLDHDKLVRLIEKKIDLKPGGAVKREKPSSFIAKPDPVIIKKDITQSHICIGGRGISYDDPDRYAVLLMNTILGSGMSSRLFQRVRERNGLAYSVYSFQETFSDSGLFGVYAGTEESQIPKAVDLIEQELDKLCTKSLTPSELKRTKDQLKGSIVLGLENISTRMNRLGKMEIFYKQYISLDELINRIDQITVEDVTKVANKLFSNTLHKSFLVPSGD